MPPFFSNSSWSAKNNQPQSPQCGACGLARQCFSPRMAVTGKGRNGVLVVAEAPGEQEDRRGEQLIGDAGQLLRKLLKEIGVDLEDCWKTNAVICRPPRNEIQPVHVESCRPNLLKTIAQLKPKVIILLGSSAVESLIGTEWQRNIGGIGRWAGWTIPSPTYNAWLCPTYHPSYLKRMDEDPVLCRQVKDHLRKAFSLVGQPPVATALMALQGLVEPVEAPTAVRAKLRDLGQRDGYLAFDFETNMLKPDRAEGRIICCSFSLDGKTAWAGMIGERELPLLSIVLRNPNLKKIGSNNKFEERWARAKLGHGVAGWFWDTMIAAHVHDNRPDITSVKFQSYVLLGVPGYEDSLGGKLKAHGSNDLNHIEDIHPRDLLVYCGVDSLVEYRVACMQRKMMGFDKRSNGE